MKVLNWLRLQVGVGTSVGQVKVKDFDPKHTVYDLLHSYYDGVPFAIEGSTSPTLIWLG